MADQVGKNATMKGTNQFMRKGHTSGAYGNQPAVQAKGQGRQTAQELKP